MTNMPQFAETSKASVDSFFATAGKSLEGIEQLATLNLQVLKTSLAEFSELSLATLSAKDASEVAKLQSEALKAVPPKMLAYGRQVMDILTSATAEQRAAAEAQVAEVQAKFVEAVSGALKNAPGADSALALIKSAVATSNNAYDGVKKASKQVTDAVDANVTKITETATKAIAS